ncbi:MAG: hypothetical protein ACREFU_00325 [Acetobacteraceae bacterium]
MAAQIAGRHNPTFSAFKQRLLAEGKKRQVAIVAVMRELLTTLNAMLRDGVAWRAPAAAWESFLVRLSAISSSRPARSHRPDHGANLSTVGRRKRNEKDVAHPTLSPPKGLWWSHKSESTCPFGGASMPWSLLTAGERLGWFRMSSAVSETSGCAG